ncbi:Transcriptional regulator, TetR family [Mycobacterium marinum str. Europe]|nr:Transcriptional regulator, TetR family [Mycobacterium marinum str. Europe]
MDQPLPSGCGPGPKVGLYDVGMGLPGLENRPEHPHHAGVQRLPGAGVCSARPA